MSKLNIAIFGSSGAIGSALCKKYTEQDNVEKVFGHMLPQFRCMTSFYGRKDVFLTFF